MIKIILPGEPVAWMRAGRNGKFTYDPQKSIKTAYKFQILDQLRDQQHILPIAPKVALHAVFKFYFSIPKGKEKLSSWGALEHTEYPDFDNLTKLLSDCMSKLIFDDDRQINIAHVCKYYDANPRSEIHIMRSKPSISDKIKEVLSYISKEEFIEFATDMEEVAENLIFVGQENSEHKEIDRQEAAFFLCAFSEKYASFLTKINKKFPGFANVIKDEIEKNEGL